VQEAIPESPRGERRTEWTTRRTILLVLAVAVTTRLWGLAALPLVITNDGVDYITTAEILHRGEGLAIRAVRTPAYPVFLAGMFHLFGVGPVGVLLGQHAVGCLTCVLLTFVACRLAGPKLALISGLLVTFDPWLFAFESYALSEPLAVLFVALAAALTLCWNSPRFYVAVLLGAALTLGCLTRPALQVIVPFFGIGWLLKSYPRWRTRALGFAWLLIGLLATLAPWLYYNSQRGIPRVASGLAALQWGSLAMFDLVDWSYPVDDTVRKEYERFADKKPSGYELLEYLQDVEAFTTRADLFRKWNRASLLANFDRYIRIWPEALAWQLNYKFPDGRVTYDQLNWFIARLGRNGSNRQYEGNPSPALMAHFAQNGEGGPLRWLMNWWAAHRIPGVPQIPLFGFALLTLLLAVVRREWAIASVFAGSIAFLLFHASLLKPPARYAIPAWIVWYLALALLPALIASFRKRSREPAPGSKPVLNEGQDQAGTNRPNGPHGD
jgi:4-amino-4-deoxy-L-arabinose transferase-like glycosyltransferase